MTPRYKVLVVDDEPTLLAATARMLTSAGYDVAEASGWEEALRIVRETKPHLALIDVVLPEMDGNEICKLIKADRETAQTLVMLITAYKRDSDQMTASLESGADEYIIRPIDNRQLLARVRAMCRIIEANENARMANEEAEKRVQDKLARFLENNQALQAEITSRTRAEESLEKERSLLLALIQNLPDAVCLKDLNSRYVMANPACIQALGAGSLDEMVGKSDLDFVRADLAAEHLAEEKLILETGIPIVNQDRTKISPETGEIISSFLTTKVPVKDHSGEKVGLLVINRYITERKKAEMALRTSEERFRSVWESSADGMRLTDDSGQIIDVNDAYCHMMKMSRAELVGEMFTKSYRRHDHHDAIEVFRRNFARQQVVPRSSTKVHLWNGEDVDVEILHSFIEHGENKKMLLSIFRDVTDRTRAEHLLQEERNLLRTLIDAIPDEIVVKDSERRFVLVNPAATRALTCSSAAEVVGKKDEDLIPPNFAREAQEEEDRVLASGRPFLNKMGRSKLNPITGLVERGILISKIPLLDRSGQITGLVGINRDVTELMQTEEKLRSQYATLGAILESTDSVIFSVDANYRYTSFNSNHASAMKALYGVTIELGHTMLDYQTVEEDRIKAKKNLDRALGGEQFVDSSYSGDQTRSRFYLEVAHNPIRDADGKVTGVAVFVRDITRQREAQEALRESEELYRTLVDTSPDAIVVTNLKGNIILCSNQAARLYGSDNVETLLGRNAMEFVARENRTRAAINFRKTLKDGSTQDLEYVLLRSDGSRFYGSMSASVLRDTARNTKGFIAIIRDVSEFKRMEAEQAYQTLLHKFRGEIAYLISRQDPIGETLRRTVNAIVGDFEVACAQIWMLEGKMELRAQAGDRNICGDPENRAHIGGVIAHAAHQENRAILQNSLSSDPLFSDDAWARGGGIVAYAGIPLYIEGRVVGVVVILSKLPLREQTMSPLAGAAVTLAQGIVRKEAEQRLRESQEQLRALAGRNEIVREEERKHIARELHDELGQSLTALKMDHASLARDLMESGSRSAMEFIERLNSMSNIIDHTVERVQSMALELRPDILDTLGLLEAVAWYAEEFQRRSGILCAMRLPKKAFVVDEQVVTALFRILQEALTNVARHSGATHVSIELTKNVDEIVLDVQDNGRGIGEDEKESHSAFGILGMTERVLRLGGKLEINGVPGQGTRISVRIPAKEPGDGASKRGKDRT